MRITSSELERFLRRTVDSGIVVRSTLGLGIGQTGVAFQYQSEQQVVIVFLQFSTAASLILAPSYAPKEAVEEIADRKPFEMVNLKNWVISTTSSLDGFTRMWMKIWNHPRDDFFRVRNLCRPKYFSLFKI